LFAGVGKSGITQCDALICKNASKSYSRRRSDDASIARGAQPFSGSKVKTMSLFGFIPSAYAQSAAGAAGASSGPLEMLQQFAPFIIVIGIFYFLLIRPQQQKAKELRAQLSQLRRGDNIVTAGGIIGTVSRLVNDDELSVEIAEGVRVRVVRSTVTGIASKGEPRPDKADDEVEKPKPVRRGKTPPANESKPQS